MNTQPQPPTPDPWWQTLIFPEELRRALTSAPWDGGYRWFESPNVIKLEDHRPSDSPPRRRIWRSEPCRIFQFPGKVR